MPNWCRNILNVSGDEAAVAEFASKLTENELGEPTLSFNAFVPMPEELAGISRGGRQIDGEYVRHWREVVDDKTGERVAVKVDQAALREKYGHSDWYEWSIANWGTKWDANDADASVEPGRVYASFDTAWGPPVEFVVKLQDLYPDLEIELDFLETGMAIYGKLEADGSETDLSDKYRRVAFVLGKDEDVQRFEVEVPLYDLEGPFERDESELFEDALDYHDAVGELGAEQARALLEQGYEYLDMEVAGEPVTA